MLRLRTSKAGLLACGFLLGCPVSVAAGSFSGGASSRSSSAGSASSLSSYVDFLPDDSILRSAAALPPDHPTKVASLREIVGNEVCDEAIKSALRLTRGNEEDAAHMRVHDSTTLPSFTKHEQQYKRRQDECGGSAGQIHTDL